VSRSEQPFANLAFSEGPWTLPLLNFRFARYSEQNRCGAEGLKRARMSSMIVADPPLRNSATFLFVHEAFWSSRYELRAIPHESLN
jgi:hypothetical protein